jgi:Ser/Thr protein kinase RdoA (MazF antagonist)
MEDMIKIAESFGIKPSCVYKTKYFYTVRCGRNEYRIIPTSLSESRLKELYNIKLKLFASGLKVCDKPLLTAEGMSLVEGDEGNYIMTESVKGHNPEFENRDEIKRTFAAIGSMHNVLRRIDCAGGDILQDYKKGCEKLKSIKKQLGCAKKLNDCDIEYIHRYKEYYEIAQNAVSVLDGLSFGAACPIHGAIKEDNIFVGRDIVLTDWEMCRCGHFMEDVAQLIARYIRKFAYHSDNFLTIDEILNEYTKQNPSSDKELAILYALLMYPKRYISVSTKHYSKSHKFMPAGVKRKFDEEYEQREFYLKYIGVV